MNDERSRNDSGEKSWIGKIADAFSSEPKTQEDVLEILRIAAENEVIDKEAHTILEGALLVTEMQAREIMVPRPKMVVLKMDCPLPELLDTIIKSGHSRYPVIGETSDDIKGILLSKDLLPELLKAPDSEFDMSAILRPANVVPESKRLNVLLRDFREKRNHMAVVIDEYGGVAGLVTIEDVLEQIVGEIEDEYDVENDSYIRKIADNDFIVKALTPIDEFNEFFDAGLSDEEFDTMGGLILQKFGYLPKRNEIAHVENFEFKVINSDSRQVHLLRMRIT